MPSSTFCEEVWLLIFLTVGSEWDSQTVKIATVEEELEEQMNSPNSKGIRCLNQIHFVQGQKGQFNDLYFLPLIC